MSAKPYSPQIPLVVRSVSSSNLARTASSPDLFLINDPQHPHSTNLKYPSSAGRSVVPRKPIPLGSGWGATFAEASNPFVERISAAVSQYFEPSLSGSTRDFQSFPSLDENGNPCCNNLYLLRNQHRLTDGDCDSDYDNVNERDEVGNNENDVIEKNWDSVEESLLQSYSTISEIFRRSSRIPYSDDLPETSSTDDPSSPLLRVKSFSLPDLRDFSLCLSNCVPSKIFSNSVIDLRLQSVLKLHSCGNLKHIIRRTKSYVNSNLICSICYSLSSPDESDSATCSCLKYYAIGLKVDDTYFTRLRQNLTSEHDGKVHSKSRNEPIKLNKYRNTLEEDVNANSIISVDQSIEDQPLYEVKMGNSSSSKLKDNKDRLKITKGRSSSRDTLIDEGGHRSTVQEEVPAGQNTKPFESSQELPLVDSEDKENGSQNDELGAFVTESFRKAKLKEGGEEELRVSSDNRTSKSLSFKTTSSDSVFHETANEFSSHVTNELSEKSRGGSSNKGNSVRLSQHSSKNGSLSPTDSLKIKFESSNTTSLMEVLELTNNLSQSCFSTATTSCLPFRSSNTTKYSSANEVSPIVSNSRIENGMSTRIENGMSSLVGDKWGSARKSDRLVGVVDEGRESPPYQPQQVNNTRLSYPRDAAQVGCTSLSPRDGNVCLTGPSSFESASESFVENGAVPPDLFNKKSDREKSDLSYTGKKLFSSENLPKIPSPVSPLRSPRPPDQTFDDDEFLYEIFVEDRSPLSRSGSNRLTVDSLSYGGAPWRSISYEGKTRDSCLTMPQASAGRGPTTFRVTRHRKVDLQPAAVDPLNGELHHWGASYFVTWQAIIIM